MYNPHPGTINIATISTAVGMVIGLIITGLSMYVLPKFFPRLRRPEVSFWVFLAILLMTSVGSMFILTTLQSNVKQTRSRVQ